MQKSIPTFSVLSIVIPVVAFVALTLGIRADTGVGTVVALAALILGPLLGIGFGVAGIFTREQPAIAPVVGLLCSVLFALFFFLR
jgi:hypothetical protein